MAMIDNKMLIMRIAREYYLEGLSQQEIASKENLHRTQVSRALKNARDRGFVKIEIVKPQYYENEELETSIQSALRLHKVCIAPCNENKQLDFFSFAAECLEETLIDRKNVGIGWGTTIYQTAAKLYYQTPADKIDFYAVSGVSGIDKAYLQTNSLVNSFAQCFRGIGHYNNFLPYISKENMSNLDIKRYKAMSAMWKKLDTVVLSIGGTLTENFTHYEEFPSPDSLKELSGLSYVELLGYLFSEKNDIYSIGDEYLITSIPLPMLKKVPDVICISKGSHKVTSIINAAKFGYINTLITDQETALEIMELL